MPKNDGVRSLPAPIFESLDTIAAAEVDESAIGVDGLHRVAKAGIKAIVTPLECAILIGCAATMGFGISGRKHRAVGIDAQVTKLFGHPCLHGVVAEGIA